MRKVKVRKLIPKSYYQDNEMRRYKGRGPSILRALQEIKPLAEFEYDIICGADTCKEMEVEADRIIAREKSKLRALRLKLGGG